MENKILETVNRIKALRELLEFTVEDMATATGLTPSEYESHERGECDLGFTFLYNCADKFGVDIIELLTGENPHLMSYSIVRKDKGLVIKRREGFNYQHLGYRFKNKYAESFLVTAPYIEEEQHKPIHLSTHEGQEFDYILEGTLKVRMGNKIEILNAGDSIYYDSGNGHGMIATNGETCKFLAITIHAPKSDK